MNHLQRRKRRLPLVLSFCIPFAVVVLSFCVAGIWPVGDGQALAHDGWHQYYPFFAAFREKLLSGGSLQYTWDVGMGTSYLSLYAYYLACPLNFLTVLIPASLLREYFALLIVLKVSLSGLFFAWYLKLVFYRNDWTLPFFGMLYAFCAYIAGYYWNLMWLDVLAIFPLLVAGTVCLLRDGKFRLYTASLALSLWCNYYLSFFCCIFVALAFFGYCICRPNGFAGFWRRLARVALCTLLSVGVTAALLLPTLYALGNTYSAASELPRLLAMNIAESGSGTIGEGGVWETLRTETIPGFLSAARQVLSGLLTSTVPTKMEGLPNLFCGFSTVALAVFYFCCKRIRLREKLVSLALLLFFLASFIFRILDYVWHGFHFPNMLPYRFSFLFSFVLITMAFRAYTQLRWFKPWHLAVILPVCLGLAACGLGEEDAVRRIALSAVCLLICCAAMVLYYKNRREAAAIVLAGVFSLEMVASFAIGVATVAMTTRSTYPREGEDVQAVLEAMQEREPEELFWRTEVSNTQTLNDGALNGYHGVSIFTSSANVRFNRFSRSLGLASWPASNRYAYYESTPFSNLMCGIKYLIDRDGKQLDRSVNTLAAASGDVLLLENTSYISLGFVTNSKLSEFVTEENRYNPILEQEEMFRLATGLEAPLYTHLKHSGLEAPGDATLRASGTSGTQYSYSTEKQTDSTDLSISYTVGEDGFFCATTKSSGNYDLDVYCNGELLFSRNIKVRCLFGIGTFSAGDTLTFTYAVEAGKSGTISLDVAEQNDAVFNEGLELLSRSPWELTEFSDTKIAGTIDAVQDGLFYTSIPCEPGWQAFVDGQEVALAETYDPENKDLKLTDSVIAFPLTQGRHEIVLRYRAPGLNTGIAVSAVCLTALAALWIGLRRRPVLFPDPKRKPAAPVQPAIEEPTESVSPTERNDFYE